MSGWIKLHRSSFENQLYFKDKFTDWQAWVDLLLLANHKDNYFSKNGRRVLVKRGQVGYSIKELAKRWRWSRGKVSRFISFLASDLVQQISPQKNNTTTLISILNYEKYQSGSTAEWFADDTADGPQTDTNKNDKKYSLVKHSEKNEKKESIRGLSAGEILYTGRYGSDLPDPYRSKKDDIGSEGNR